MEENMQGNGHIGTAAYTYDERGVLVVHDGEFTMEEWRECRPEGCIYALAFDDALLASGSADGMFFEDWGSLRTVDLSGLDLSNAITMSGMFCGCASLEHVFGLPGLDVSAVEDMAYMFEGCRALGSPYIARWDVSSVRNMHCMFAGCASLATLDLSGWDTSSVEDMSGMFEDCGSLTTLDLSGWDVSGVMCMQDVFRGCDALKALDLTGWDMSAAQAALKTLDYQGYAMCERHPAKQASGHRATVLF